MSKIQSMVSLPSYIDFLNKIKTPYHLINFCHDYLPLLGFSKVDSIDGMPGKYYMVKNTSIFIFIIPEKYTEAIIFASHSDSPSIKLSPEYFNSGNLEITFYGGGLWHTWFDRPLRLSGMVFQNGKNKLVDFPGPFFLPSLPPHLNIDTYKDGMRFTRDQLKMMNLDSLELENIDFADLFFSDYNEGRVIDKYIFSPRQDNLHSVYCSLFALKNISPAKLICFSIYDFEEIGSLKYSGAQAEMLKEILDSLKIKKEDSLIVSMDGAHAYNEMYTKNFIKSAPTLNTGILIKHSPTYSTEYHTTVNLIDLMKKNNLRFKNYVNCSRVRGGSTIGAMMSCILGIPGIDIGTPLLSMHSICEITHEDDLTEMIRLLNILIQK